MVTNSTLQRSFSKLIAHDGTISMRDAANFSTYKLINYFLGLLNYCGIEEKRQTLSEENETRVIEGCLNEKSDSRGNYSFCLSLGDEKFSVSDVGGRGVNLGISRGLFPVSSHNSKKARFVDLKRVLLRRYLDINNEPGRASTINVSQFDLQDVNLSGINLRGANLKDINFTGAILDRSNLEAILAAGGNISGATLAPGIDVSGMTFQSVKMDKIMLSALVAAGADL